MRERVVRSVYVTKLQSQMTALEIEITIDMIMLTTTVAVCTIFVTISTIFIGIIENISSFGAFFCKASDLMCRYVNHSYMYHTFES